MKMSIKERVTKHNKQKMKRLIRNGSYNYPGAVEIIKKGQLYTRWNMDREEIARNLQYGDTVLRHIMDDDIVLFNR